MEYLLHRYPFQRAYELLLPKESEKQQSFGPQNSQAYQSTISQPSHKAIRCCSIRQGKFVPESISLSFAITQREQWAYSGGSNPKSVIKAFWGFLWNQQPPLTLLPPHPCHLLPKPQLDFAYSFAKVASRSPNLSNENFWNIWVVDLNTTHIYTIVKVSLAPVSTMNQSTKPTNSRSTSSVTLSTPFEDKLTVFSSRYR